MEKLKKQWSEIYMQTKDFFNVSMNISTDGNSDQKMKHAEHDINVKHSNKNIDFSLSHYNEIWHSGKTADDVLKETYQPYFDEYNKHARKGRKVTNINDYFKSKKGYVGNDFTMVLSIGTKEEWDKLKEINPKLHESMMRTASHYLADYAEHFNAKHKNLELINYATNVDESSPHIHMQVVKKGFTKGGKPSPSLNVALKAETGESSNQKALSKFNQNECKAVQDDFEHIREVFDDNHGLSQALTNEHEKHMKIKRPMGMSQADYIQTINLANEAKKQRETIEKLKRKNKQLQDENEQLEAKKKANQKENEELKQENQRLKDEQQENQEMLDNMQELQENIKNSNSQLITRNDVLTTRNKRLMSENQTLSTENINAKNDFDRISKQYDDLATKYQDMSKQFDEYYNGQMSILSKQSFVKEVMTTKPKALEESKELSPIFERNKHYHHKKRKKYRSKSNDGPEL